MPASLNALENNAQETMPTIKIGGPCAKMPQSPCKIDGVGLSDIQRRRGWRLLTVGAGLLTVRTLPPKSFNDVVDGDALVLSQEIVGQRMKAPAHAPLPAMIQVPPKVAYPANFRRWRSPSYKKGKRLRSKQRKSRRKRRKREAKLNKKLKNLLNDPHKKPRQTANPMAAMNPMGAMNPMMAFTSGMFGNNNKTSTGTKPATQTASTNGSALLTNVGKSAAPTQPIITMPQSATPAPVTPVSTNAFPATQLVSCMTSKTQNPLPPKFPRAPAPDEENNSETEDKQLDESIDQGQEGSDNGTSSAELEEKDSNDGLTSQTLLTGSQSDREASDAQPVLTTEDETAVTEEDRSSVTEEHRLSVTAGDRSSVTGKDAGFEGSQNFLAADTPQSPGSPESLRSLESPQFPGSVRANCSFYYANKRIFDKYGAARPMFDNGNLERPTISRTSAVKRELMSRGKILPRGVTPSFLVHRTSKGQIAMLPFPGGEEVPIEEALFAASGTSFSPSIWDPRNVVTPTTEQVLGDLQACKTVSNKLTPNIRSILHEQLETSKTALKFTRVSASLFGFDQQPRITITNDEALFVEQLLGRVVHLPKNFRGTDDARCYAVIMRAPSLDNMTLLPSEKQKEVIVKFFKTATEARIWAIYGILFDLLNFADGADVLPIKGGRPYTALGGATLTVAYEVYDNGFIPVILTNYGDNTPFLLSVLRRVVGSPDSPPVVFHPEHAFPLNFDSRSGNLFWRICSNAAGKELVTNPFELPNDCAAHMCAEVAPKTRKSWFRFWR